MILNRGANTEVKEADFAIFLTAGGGILARGSIIALGLTSLELGMTADPLLCRVMSRGPACANLFSKTLKYDLMLSSRL